MKPIIPVVAACIVQRHPLRILLQRKFEAHDEAGVPRNPELVGKWELPGGMMNYGETPEQALKREVQEELGIPVTILRLLTALTCIYADSKHYLVLFYECQTSYDREPGGGRYFSPAQIAGLDCLPNTLTVVQMVSGLYPGG